MAWCIANDLPEAAVVYGHAAGETDTVAGLVDALALPLYYDGRMETLEEWLGWFGDDELRRYPALAVYGAWVRALTGRPAEAERWLALADGATSAIPLSDGSATIEPWVATLRAHMMPDGVEQALADADLALDQLSPGKRLDPGGAARSRRRARAARRNRSRDGGPRGDRRDGAGRGAVGRASILAQAQLALLAAKQGAWGEAGQRARAAQALVEESGPRRLLVERACARGDGARRTPRGETGGCPRGADARAPSAAAARPRPSLADRPGRARAHARPSRTRRGRRRPHGSHRDRAACSSSARTWARWSTDARELRDRVAATSGPGGAWAMSLTGAELRLLPYLATHLTFPEIASRLFISRNTVKTEAVSIYRKLGVSSRSEAIERAIEVGLLESSIYPPRANLIQKV